MVKLHCGGVLPVKQASAHTHPVRSLRPGISSGWTFEKPLITPKDFRSPVNFHHVRKILCYDSYITKQFIEVAVTSHFNCCYLFRQQSPGRACQHQEKRKGSMLLKSEFHFKQNKQRHPDHYMKKFHMNLLLHFCSSPPLALLTSLLAKKIKKVQIIWDTALLLGINLVEDLTEKSLYFCTLYIIGWNSVKL